LPKADDCHYTSIGTVFSVTLYIQSRYNGCEIGREKSDPERVYRLRREAKTSDKTILREVPEKTSIRPNWYAVFNVTRDMEAVHPDDIGRYLPSDGDLGWWLIGNDCARILGMEWTLPEIVA
jgi:hypothetical protein